MKFGTKLWRRSEKSFATTIPQALLFLLDPEKKYDVEWVYDLKHKVWCVDFLEAVKKQKQEKARLVTSLWKRSQRSYATTVPHAVMLYIDEEKDNSIEWEFDKKLQKWIVSVREVGK